MAIVEIHAAVSQKTIFITSLITLDSQNMADCGQYIQIYND